LTEVLADAATRSQHWPREAFNSSATADWSCPAVIDVTGRPRCLVFGPYRVLSPGLWRAVVRFRLCEDAARARFAVEFGAIPDLTGRDPPPWTPGAHALEIVHGFARPTAAEIRIHLARAAFHGELRFEGASVERLGDLPESEVAVL
jgi:hypothetical protein